MIVAFKEWAVVDAALGAGAQSILLRKGGIHERQGRFELEHRRFLIYPTYSHQRADLIKPAFRDLCADDRRDRSRVRIQHLAEVEQVFTAPANAASTSEWERLHVYAPALIRMRYDYKPHRPLYVLLVRASRLPRPAEIVETPCYAGCRSWVLLNDSVDTAGAKPVLSDDDFLAVGARLRAVLATRT